MLFSSAMEHSSYALLPLLRGCRTVRDLAQVHAHIIRRGCHQDHFLIARFLAICGALTPSNLSYPTAVFNCVACPNIYLWNILMRMHCDGSSLGECFAVFSRMRKASTVAPDKYTFPSLISACSNAVALREGIAVHGMTVRSGNDGDVFVGSSLVDFYGKCGEIGCARKVFDEMPVRNEVSWTALMLGCLNVGELDNARRLFDEMPKRNQTTWNVMIKGLVKLGSLVSARKVFDEMPHKSEVSFTTMIDGYAMAGDMAAARSLFDELPHKDLVSWSVLMSGYVQNGRPVEAVKVFSELWEMGFQPDEFLLVSLMCACSQLGSSELARWIESYLIAGAFDVSRVHVAAALVDMNVKCGNMERATAVFEEMPRRDLISYCSMMQGLCIHSRSNEAVSLFDRMIGEGIRPDSIAFMVILTACSYTGLVDEGCRLFNSMIHEYSITPSPDHYACMVNLFGKSGRLKAAYELIQSVPVESHPGAWGALLGACRLQCDVDLAEAVASRLFKLEPCFGGSYVLLSNIYAEADRWSSISHLREVMTDRGIRKIPGYSYVDQTSST